MTSTATRTEAHPAVQTSDKPDARTLAQRKTELEAQTAQLIADLLAKRADLTKELESIAGELDALGWKKQRKARAKKATAK